MTSKSDSPELEKAIQAVLASSADPSLWDVVEELGAAAQAHERVAAAYRDALRKGSKDTALAIGQRAAQWHEEWLGDDAKGLSEVLSRVLDLDGTASWAFQRLTVLHTSHGQWDELLAVYDRAIARATTKDEKRTLLDEAANIAKDFANDIDASLRYLTELLKLSPDDKVLAETLERQLERQGRWAELVDIWRDRANTARGDARAQLEVRMADALYAKLGRTSDAMALLRGLVGTGDRSAGSVELLERMAGDEILGEDLRREALELLSTRYKAENRNTDLVRTLEAKLELADGEESASLHRETAERLRANGDRRGAMDHYVAVLRLEPGAQDALGALRELSAETGEVRLFVDALDQAADRAEDVKDRVALLEESADLLRDSLGDTAGAVDRLRRIVDSRGVDKAERLKVLGRLASLHHEQGQVAHELAALDALLREEPDATVRRTLAGQVARLAASLGDAEKALATWRGVLEANPADAEAIDAMVGILEQAERHRELAEVLEARAKAAPGSFAARADFARAARLYADKLADSDRSLALWKRVAKDYGEDPETVDAISSLLARAGQWEELAAVLVTAAEREADHVAKVLAEAGAVQRDRMGDAPSAAASFARALLVNPAHLPSREGLSALLEDPGARPLAADALAEAYRRTDEWQAALQLLDVRLALAASDEERVRLLGDATRLVVARGGDKAEAFGYLKRAAALAPADESLDADLVALGAAVRKLDEVVATLRTMAAAVTEGSPRWMSLEERAAHLLEAQLQDFGGAFAVQVGVLTHAPDRRSVAEAAVRTGLAAGNVRGAVEAAIRHGSAVGRFDAGLFDLVGGAVSTATDAESLARAVRETVEATALSGQPAHDVALWAARHVLAVDGHAATARALATEAARHNPLSRGALELLVELGRSEGDHAFFDVLLRVATFDERNLDALHEAAVVAADAGVTADERERLLGELYRRASVLWRDGAKATGQRSAEEVARFALGELARAHETRKAWGELASLAEGARTLPLSDEERIVWLERAADAALQAGARDRASSAYRALLDLVPGHSRALDVLASMAEADGRLPEMLTLRRIELATTTDRERRLALRLEMVRLVGEIERRAGRVEALLENLREQPGHRATIQALIDVLEPAGRRAELADLLQEQARHLEGEGHAVAAAGLWTRVANLAEEHLGELDRAVLAYRRVVELHATPEALDALARLRADHGDHAQAAQWLERRLLVAEPADRAHIALRLARAHLAAGQRDRAVQRLETAFRENPASPEIRETLADAYRSDGKPEQLAWVLVESSAHERDRERLVQSAHEAANILRGLGKLDKALPLLRRAAEVAPDDREVGVLYADALRVTGDHDGARRVLDGLIEGFGRRRNPERAQIHFLMAQVEHAQGHVAAALQQLDLAAGMDPANTHVLRTLGDFALDGADLARAERAHRALLLTVRRQPPGDDPAAVGLAEVQYALHRVAKARGDEAQAKELLASALESAAASDVETERLVRAATRTGDGELARTALERRLPDATDRAKILMSLGRVLWSALNRGDEALERYLEALEQSPFDDGLHRQIRVLAVEVDGSLRYAAKVEAIARRLLAEDSKAGAELLLRLVRVLEEDVGDLERAQATAAEAQATGHHQAEAWQALARLARARGDRAAEIRALEEIVSMPDDGIAPGLRTDAMFNLAALRLTDQGHRDEGVALLHQALEREPRFTQVGGLLRTVSTEPSPSLLSLYGRVARSTTDTSILLDYLEKRAARPEATVDEVREAIDLAASVGDPGRLEGLLERAIGVARNTPEGLQGHVAFAERLAEQRVARGDVPGALRWMREAADATSGDRSLDLWLGAAGLAARGGAWDEALGIYEDLYAAHPSDRRVWEPFLGALRTVGAEERFNDVMAAVVDGLATPADRNAVRMERARYLLTLEGREPDAAEVLRQILAEEPGHASAGSLLADLFERTGYSDDLVELLSQQLQAARAERDIPTIKELSLRLGTVLGRVQREHAMEVYRHLFTWLPDDRDAALALLALFSDDHDATERAEVMERILRTEEGEAAAALALDLADRWQVLGDDVAVVRVLELGYGASPEVVALRERLESAYQGAGAWAELAGLLVREARRVTDATARLVLFKNAAALYLDQLGDAPTAAEVLYEAHQQVPDDADLLGTLVAARVAAGELTQAEREVGRAMERPGLTDAGRAHLLRARGGVRLAMGQDADAVSDLEQAYALGGASFGVELAEGLETAAERARERGEAEGERHTVLRLVQVLSELGQGERARELLSTWVEAAPRDREALELLAAIDEAAERWEGVMDTTRRLVDITEGEARFEAAMAHADACTKAGRPDDARPLLEALVRENPDAATLRARLLRLYEEAGAHGELAVLVMEDAAKEASEDKRHALLRKAGFLFLQGGNPEAALAPLEEAVRLRPTDHESVLLLVDGFIQGERFAQAGEILERAIEAHPKKRSPELAELQQRMALLAEKAGDPNLQMQWLAAAMESDKTNGDVVAKLAYLAMDLKEYDMALNALRVVTLSKSDGPMSRAMAFLLQARIAHEQGEQRKALLWARKAKSEDPNFAEADAFIAELGG